MPALSEPLSHYRGVRFGGIKIATSSEQQVGCLAIERPQTGVVAVASHEGPSRFSEQHG